MNKKMSTILFGTVITVLAVFAVIGVVSLLEPDKSHVETPHQKSTPRNSSKARSENFVSRPISSGNVQSQPKVDKTARYFAELADVHFKFGKYREAAELYSHAIGAEKDLSSSAVYHYWLGRSHLAVGEKEQAKQEYHKVIEINKKLVGEDAGNSNFYFNKISLVYEELGDNIKALEWAQKIDAKKLVTPASLLRTAALCIRAKDYDKAIEHCMKALNLPQKPASRSEVELYLADCYARAGKQDKAIAVLKNAAEKASSKKTKDAAKAALFTLYRKLGKLDKIEFKDISKDKVETGKEGEKK